MSESYIEKVLERFINNKKETTPSRKFFDKIYEFVENPDGQLSTPWNVSWQICAECNLRCKHCFFEGNESLYNCNQDLPTDKMLALVDELADDCSVVNLTITGGEPFLRKDIFEIIKKLKSKNIVLYIQTNATLIDEEKAKKLSKILNPALDSMQVSLDGACEDFHSKIRGKGAFEKTINGIKNLNKYSIPITVNATALSTNLDELIEIYKLCVDLNIKKFSLTRFIPSNNSQQYLVPEPEKLFRVLSEIIDLEKDFGKKVPFDMHTIRFFDLVTTEKNRKIVDNYLKENKVKPPILCDNVSCHLHNILYINCDGEVSFCFLANDKGISLGNAKTSSLLDLWEKRDKNIFFEPRLKQNMLCLKCKYFAYCKGGCMALAYKYYNNKDYPDGMCQYAKEQFAI